MIYLNFKNEYHQYILFVKILIYCFRPTNDKQVNRNNFSHKELSLVKVLNKFIAQRMLSLKTKYRSAQASKRSMAILEGFKSCTHEKNLASLFNQINSFMPQIFNVQS